MASTASFRCGGNCTLLDRRFGNVRIPNGHVARSCSLGKKTTISAISLTASNDNRSAPGSGSISRFESKGIARINRGSSEAVAYEKLDRWMRESVVDIVKNLREGPLMVHVYRRGKISGGGGGGGVSEVTLEMEKAVAEKDWEAARGRWDAGTAPVPEGLIFVEELSERQEGDENEIKKEINDSEIDGVTRAWGVVIQGRGADCPPACYLLKTSTAGSGCGLGLGCTHFCLVRVSGFWETTESQLKNCWLLQAQAHFKAHGP